MDVALCVCAIARNESRYLLEWVAYQRVLGAEMVVIYDNGHERTGSMLLHKLDACGLITRVDWRREFPHGAQVPAYNDAIQRLTGRAEWVLFVDLDEYVVPVRDDTLVEFLAGASDAEAVWFPWLIFGSSGQRFRTEGLVIERFLRRQVVDDETVTPVKSAVRPDRVERADLHVHHIKSDAYENPLGELGYITNSAGERRAAQPARGYEVARVHHYMTKSFQEWAEKVARGRADFGYEDPSRGRSVDEFSQWDRNEIFDDTALRYASRLKAEIEVVRHRAAIEDIWAR